MPVAETGQFATPVRTRSHRKTSTTPRLHSSEDRCRHVLLPASPQLKVLGYGTGVRVALMERSSPRPGGTYRSPWAVKQLSRSQAADSSSETSRRLEQEGRLLRQLQHPCIVGFRGVASGSRPGSVSLCMEAAGSSLMELIERRAESQSADVSISPFPLSDILTVGSDVASALDYLHTQHRLLHADVKAANVLVFGQFMRAKLCDFGVTVRLDEELRADCVHYVGTECWAAPEVIRYQHGLDKSTEEAMVTDKADVFSFALTLWEMFALDMPHCPRVSDSLELDSECEELEEFGELSAEELMEPPPLPSYSEAVMNEYSGFVELYAVCVQREPQRRPSAKQCCQMLTSLRETLNASK